MGVIVAGVITNYFISKFLINLPVITLGDCPPGDEIDGPVDHPAAILTEKIKEKINPMIQ